MSLYVCKLRATTTSDVRTHQDTKRTRGCVQWFHWPLAVPADRQLISGRSSPPLALAVLVLFFLCEVGRRRPPGTLVCDAAAQVIRVNRSHHSPTPTSRTSGPGPLDSLLSIGGGGPFIHSHAVPPTPTPAALCFVRVRRFELWIWPSP